MFAQIKITIFRLSLNCNNNNVVKTCILIYGVVYLDHILSKKKKESHSHVQLSLLSCSKRETFIKKQIKDVSEKMCVFKRFQMGNYQIKTLTTFKYDFFVSSMSH